MESHHFLKIFEWFSDSKHLSYIFLAFLTVLLGIVLYALGYFAVVVVRALAIKLAAVFPPTKEESLQLIPYLLALFAMLAVFAFALAFLISLFIFLFNSCRSVCWKLNGRLDWGASAPEEQKRNASKAFWAWFKRHRAARHNLELNIFIVTLLAAVSYIVLLSLQYPKNPFSLLQYTPQQVMQMAVFFVSLVLGFGAMVGSLGLLAVFLIAVVRYGKDAYHQREELREKRSLISLLMDGLGKLLETAIRILTGFRNDVLKNQAIYLACAMASVVSLLNTFFGLSKFFKAEGNIIPTICSLALAIAVQLAVLIFGMRAGECVREWLRLRSANRYVRAPAWTYLLATACFMVISSGFAYTNMFGLYARSVNLQEQVMDQVRSEASKTMKLSDRVNTVVNQYEKNRQEIQSLLDGDKKKISTKKANDEAILAANWKAENENKPREEWTWYGQNAQNRL